MLLYLIERADEVGWDEFAAFVIAAKSPDELPEIVKEACSQEPYPTYTSQWKEPVVIGTAAEGVKKGVVLSDFNAG